MGHVSSLNVSFIVTSLLWHHLCTSTLLISIHVSALNSYYQTYYYYNYSSNHYKLYFLEIFWKLLYLLFLKLISLKLYSYRHETIPENIFHRIVRKINSRTKRWLILRLILWPSHISIETTVLELVFKLFFLELFFNRIFLELFLKLLLKLFFQSYS